MPLPVSATTKSAQGSSAAGRAGFGKNLHHAVACFDGDCAARRHGVPSIEGKIEKNLLDLSRVHFDQTQVRIETEIQLDVFADQASQKVAHAFSDLVQRKQPGLAVGGTRYCK